MSRLISWIRSVGTTRILIVWLFFLGGTIAFKIAPQIAKMSSAEREAASQALPESLRVPLAIGNLFISLSCIWFYLTSTMLFNRIARRITSGHDTASWITLRVLVTLIPSFGYFYWMYTWGAFGLVQLCALVALMVAVVLFFKLPFTKKFRDKYIPQVKLWGE